MDVLSKGYFFKNLYRKIVKYVVDLLWPTLSRKFQVSLNFVKSSPCLEIYLIAFLFWVFGLLLLESGWNCWLFRYALALQHHHSLLTDSAVLALCFCMFPFSVCFSTPFEPIKIHIFFNSFRAAICPRGLKIYLKTPKVLGLLLKLRKMQDKSSLPWKVCL